VNPEILEVNRT